MKILSELALIINMTKSKAVHIPKIRSSGLFWKIMWYDNKLPQVTMHM